MKLLIKQSFKTLFSSKIFSLLLMVIIFISSLTYTFLQTSANSFRNSYNNLVEQGQLHDAVVKELYNIKGNFKTTINNKNAPKKYSIDVIMVGKDAPTDDYKNYFENHPEEVSWQFATNTNVSQKMQEKMQENRREYLQNIVLKSKPLAFQEAVGKIYDKKLKIKNTKSVFIPSGEKAFKVIEQNQNDTTVNNLLIYDGTKNFTNPLSDSEMDQKLKNRMKEAGIDESSAIINRLRGYRWTAANLFNTVDVIDPSSFQAVISPSYARLNHKKPISPKKVLELYNKNKFFDEIGQNPSWLLEYSDNLIWIDKTPYFIIGIGNTPDFSYPILDHSKPIPVYKNEALIYTNIRGYERSLDSFRNSKKEDYFSIKFTSNIDLNEKLKIKKEIEEIARKGRDAEISFSFNNNSNILKNVDPMAWPSNIKIVTDYNEINDSVILAGQRVAFLENLKNTIIILTNTTTSFLIIFVASTILLVFKSLLSSRRIKHATLLALGHSKKAIAVSISLATIVLIGLPSVIGYIFGHFLQHPFINIFAQYWTIPIYDSSFSLLSLLITVVLPLSTIFAMIFILTHWDLNNRIANMLRRQSKYRFSIAQVVLKPFVWVGVKSKYVISVTVSNFGRLILSTLAGIISVTAIIVGVSSLGKADYAYNQTINMTAHSFQVNFSSPTAEGGQYKTISYQEAIDKLDDIKNQNTQAVIGKEIHWHVPSLSDASYATPGTIISNPNEKKLEKAQHFLKYKLQFKPLLDVSLFGFNSWDLAKKLMPENQRNNAENNERELYALATKLESNQKFKNESWWPKAENDYKINGSDKMNWFSSLKPEFVSFIKNSLQELAITNHDYVPYIISYDVIIKNKGDEKYTYINGDLSNNNNLIIKNSNIIGIEQNSQSFKFNDSTRELLENYNNSDRSPLVVNKYMAEKYNLSVGSIVDFDVHNHVNRKNSAKKDLKRKFEVIDVINTYDDNRLITRKKDADTIIGFNQINKNSSDNFNGIFYNNDNPLPLQTMPLYSESDFYIATDTISDIQWQEVVQLIIKKILFDNSYFQNIKTSSDFIANYSAIPFISMFDKITPVKIINETFKSISKLTSNIIWIIQIISITLSILFAIIVSSLLVTSNNKKIASLWTLGYYRSELMKMFSLIYLLPIIFAIGLGVPLALGILSTLRLFVINFGSILIPFALSWTAILLSISIISTIFVLSTVLGIKSLKNDKARKTIKGE